MFRKLNAHEINNFNREHVAVRVLDEPGPGGAHHSYSISLETEQTGQIACTLNFQKGPVKEAGANGITDEALLAVLIDRLEGFQRGQFSCRENALALTKMQEAMHWLKHRAEDRERRGVEGRHRK